MLRNLGLSSLANFSRFCANGILFIALAALWSPDLFGRFVFYNVLALIAAMAVDYGLSVKTMRDVARSPAEARPLLFAALNAQVWLILPSALLGLAFLWSGVADHASLFVPLWLTHVLFSLTNTGYGAFRGAGRFDAEAKSALIGNSLFFGLPMAVAWAGGSLEATAAAMALARLGQACAGAYQIRALPLPARTLSLPPGQVLRDAHAYALEGWSSAVFQNADSLLVRFLLGEAALGIYQAAARLLAIAVILVQSLGNLLVPRLTAAASHAGAFRRALRQSMTAFAALGAVCFLALALLGGPVVLLVYDDAYAGSTALMPLFGLIALLRCIAAGQGYALLALGQQVYRVQAVLSALAVFVLAGVFGAGFGISGVVWAHVLAVAVLLSLYWWRVREGVPSAATAQSRPAA